MSKNIHTAQLVAVDDHSDNSATFTVEPLHSGYGHTLGNSLRRVLLSSIAGAAVTSFKIEGASHEFATLPGVKEDIVAISQNLKGIRFKVYSDEPQTVRLEKKGNGPVTAADIKLNADVEVVNPDHLIATIDDSKAQIIADIVVESGRGYRTIEEETSRKASDHIALDSIFSPVLRVRYKVENTRVGQVTDLDKLILTVDTDGSISPRDAFEEASAILVAQYSALAGKTRITISEPTNEPKLDDDDDSAATLNTTIEDLNLSARTTNALINNEIHTIKDLFELSDAELRDLKGFGSKGLDEVKNKMAELEL